MQVAGGRCLVVGRWPFRYFSFVIFHSTFVIHFSFVIRHFFHSSSSSPARRSAYRLKYAASTFSTGCESQATRGRRASGTRCPPGLVTVQSSNCPSGRYTTRRSYVLPQTMQPCRSTTRLLSVIERLLPP